MLESIEKLITLQERDRKILKVKDELHHCPLERKEIQGKYHHIRENLEHARLTVQKLESERKKLELEVEAKNELIAKYSLQQFQTKKNEEYRALANEIETCKLAIAKLEDQQLELMEQAEKVEREVKLAKAAEAEAKRTTDGRLADLQARQSTLESELAELDSNRGALAVAVEEGLRVRYERLLRSKGSNVVVGIQHGVCGGCHMQLSRQVVVSCQAEQEIMNCPNCGRILYYTPDMDLATAE